ncbi:hypothetical protein ONE63_004517 [Megalurothrips usitatus]|uniref:Uncharacterized protein n=1 Tax=Megalurothrips usitatus TaxID=439358 RepID=A0AAV7X325_9NEOP|nr:hypothetical protein ONE63_004517 [Megalurothrips usitatus]
MRHILDSTWAGLCVLERRDCTSETSHPLMTAFVGSITPFGQLDERQQAAVHAVHASFMDSEQDGKTACLLAIRFRLLPLRRNFFKKINIKKNGHCVDTTLFYEAALKVI